MKMNARYRTRIKEYLFLANRMKRNGCKVMLSSSGPYSRQAVARGDTHPFEAIREWESTGSLPPTSSPQALEWLMIGKAARDWHVEEWGRGMAEGVTTPAELLADGTPPSLVESAKKRRNSILFAH